MRRVAFALAAVVATSGVAAAQQKMALPEEPKACDPSPNTTQAADLLKRGRYEDAIRTAKMALTCNEKHVAAMVVMAKAYYFLRKYELSTSIIDIAKSIDGNNAELYNLLGFIALAHDPPDRISATAAFKKATELREDYANAWNNLAAQYLFSKNYDGAVTAAEKAASLSPNYAKAQLNLGSAYRGKERYGDADKAYKQALQLNPNYPDAFFNLGILYLDAKEIPGMDKIMQLQTAINYLNRYKQVASYNLKPDDPADSYVHEAQKAIESEQKRLERLKKQQQRSQPKAGG
jgi:tetratricopeptide (TPR) repeat protein